MNRREGRWGRMACGAALALCAWAGPAGAQHVSYWIGQGAGFFLAGGSSVRDPDSHAIGILALGLFGDRLRVRHLRGSLERDEGYQLAFGDNDVDYRAFDGVATRRLTGLPVDLGLGLARYEEGYLRPGTGNGYFVHHWGPHVSVLRDLPVWRFLTMWGECDVHYLPCRPGQVAVALDVGLGAHF